MILQRAAPDRRRVLQSRMPTFCDRLCDSDVEAIEAIRSAVHKLLPSWQRPELFFEQRSSITSGLTKLIRLIGSEPRVLGRAIPTLRVVGGETASVAALGSRYTAPRAQALALAARTFRAPAAAPQPTVDRGLSSRRPAVRTAVATRRSRRHRYPLPPTLEGQGRLAV
jgi:hypothetical protein